MSDTLHAPAYVKPTPAQVAAKHIPAGSRGICCCGEPVTLAYHPCLGPDPRWLHDSAHAACIYPHDIHLVSRP